MIKDALNRLWGRMRKGVCRFGFVELAFVGVAAFAVCLNHDGMEETDALSRMWGLCWGALAGVFAELLSERRGWHWGKVLVGGVTLGVSVLGAWFWHMIMTDSPRSMLWVMIYGGTSVALVSASLVLLYRLADERTLVARLTVNACGVAGSTAILLGSLELCLTAFIELISPVNSRVFMDVFSVTLILGPSIGFLSLLPGREEQVEEQGGHSDRALAFLFWLLLPAALILLAILYLYLAKILILRTMPSGTLNWFGSVALAAYVFFWLALKDSARRFFRVVVRWGWALLIPVVIAQIVGIVIRYQAYGLTVPRFSGMVTLSFGLVALALAAFDRHPRGLFIYIACAGLFFTLSPWNIVDVPLCDQERRLMSILEEKGIWRDGKLDAQAAALLSDEEARILISSWRYLKENDRMGAAVWHHAPWLDDLRKAADGSLPKALGLDELTLTGTCMERAQKCLLFVTPKDRPIPIAGYKGLRMMPPYGAHCFRRKGRWYVFWSEGCEADPSEYDVTDSVAPLLDAFKHADPNMRERDFSAAENVWPLTPALSLAVSELDIDVYGRKNSLHINIHECALLFKENAPQ